MVLVRRMLDAVPGTVSLEAAAWDLRHRWILRLLWAHAVVIAVVATIKDPSVVHVATDTAPIIALAVGASATWLGRHTRSVLTGIGLMVSSAVLVHLATGSIEMHFHFFVMVGVISLYHDWRPFLASIGFVALHHGIAGVLSPEGVYNHPAAQRNPMLWAGIHAFFVLGASAAAVGSWAITERSNLAGRRELEASERRFRALIENSTDVILMFDEHGRTLYVSPANEAMLGYPAAERLGTDGFGDVHPDDLERAYGVLAELVTRPGITVRVELRLRHREGHYLWVEGAATNMLDDPAVGAIVGNFRDIDDRKRLEAELAHQAFHDSLTGLANRALLVDRIEHALSRRKPERVGLLFLDIDDFKTVNDALGHEAGDEILRSVARQVVAAIRPGDTASRLGGDEFAVLLEELPDAETAYEVGTRLLEVVRTPVEIAGTLIAVNASVGVVIAGEGDDVSALIRNADLAMYRAKGDGKARLEVYEAGMHAAAVERIGLKADLRRAVEADEFVPHYQPIVELATGEIVGVEALARWEHPDRGLVPPVAFIGLAEETGLIVDIGGAILRQACRDAAGWGTSVSVNVSARQIHTPEFIDEVRAALSDTGLPAESLVLESTESVLIEDADRAAEMIGALRALGVHLALDDFGTGYSSLSYLERFPVDAVKIDKSFVDPLVSDRHGASPLISVILHMAEVLGLVVTAEGIEEQVQFEQLRRMGCQRGQGYLFAKPMPADDFADHLHKSVQV